MSEEIGTKPFGSVNMHYSLKKNPYKVDDVFLGYGALSHQGEVIHQIKLGVGFHF
jgi:hypothetical protein